jgi:hypothetical protein
MADNTNIIITVTADDSGAIQSINKLGQEINTAGDASKSWISQLADLKTQLGQLDPKSAQWAELALQYKELGGSSKVVTQSIDELKTQISDSGDKAVSASENLGSYKKELQAIRKQLDQKGLGTEEINKLTLEASKLEGKIAELSKTVDNQGAPAFAAFSSNASALGEELGNVNLKGVGDQFKSLSQNVNNFKLGSLKDGISAVKDGFVSFGKALLANPLFLLGQVILTIINNFEQIKNAVPAVAAVFNFLTGIIDGIKTAIFAVTDAIGLTEVAAVNAVDGAFASLEERGKQIDNERRKAIAEAKKTGGDVNAINKAAEDQRIADLQDAIKKANSLRGEQSDKQKEDRKKAEAELQEIFLKRLEAEGDAAEKARNDAAAAAEKAAKEAEAEAQRQADLAKQRAAERKAREKEVMDALKDAQEERYQNTLSAEDRELRQNQLKYDALVEKAGKNASLLAQIEADRLKSEQEIRDQFAKDELAKEQAKQDALNKVLRDNETERLNELETLQEAEFQAGLSAQEREKIALRDSLNAQIEILKANKESSTNLQKQLDDGLAAIDKKYRDADTAAAEEKQKKDEDRAKALKAAHIQTAQDSINTLLSLNEAFTGKSEKAQKAAFKRNKALQIAQTSVNTYQSATAAYASQLIPGDPTSVPRAFIAAAAAVAAGLANVAKISKTTFESPAPSGGGSNAGGGGGDLANTGVATTGGAPEFNPLATLGLQNQPAQVTPAYVLASDIASSMEARAKVTDLSRL